MNELEPNRREQLLADAALGWVDEADRAELDALLADPAAQREREQLERAAALGGLAVATDADGEAASLLATAAKLHADAASFFAAQRRRAPATSGLWRAAPWLLAAASVVLALWPHDAPAPVEVAPAVARSALMQRPSTEWLQWNWQPGPELRQAALAGDVVWAVGRDEGYLRLRGLPPLDPAHRYQLWVVDGKRQGPPVDGGLLPALDAVAGGAAGSVAGSAAGSAPGEVIVHVRARLPVRSAAAFVLTVEPAEGVVVSSQEHVAAIAKP